MAFIERKPYQRQPVSKQGKLNKQVANKEKPNYSVAAVMPDV